MIGIVASSGGAGGPVDPYTTAEVIALFTTQKGAVYDFTDAAMLAINADGTGGSPAVDSACRWAVDQSPNLNHLRNTVSSATRRADGVETSGSGYGLFNMADFGDWPNIAHPFEIIVTLEMIAGHTADNRIIGSDGAMLLQGSASGKARQFAGSYGAEVNPGLATEFTLDLVYDGATSGIGLDGAAMTTTNPGAATLSALCLGSTTGGASPTNTRFKRMVVREGLFSSGQRAGIIGWAGA